MSIRKFNVNKTESEIALASAMFDGFMSKEDKIALDALVASNFAGGSITSVTVTMTDVTEVKDRLTVLESSVDTLESTVSLLKNKLDSYPTLTADMKTDGQGYLLVNNVFEPVFPANCSPLYEETASATSIALASLETGKLEITEDTEPELIEEVRELLGDEIFNELAANNFSTLELHPEISDKEKVEKAKKEYLERKEIEKSYYDNLDLSEVSDTDVIKRKDESV